MNAISIEDVKKLASLSALHLSDGEVENMRQDLVQILDYVEQLNEVNTDGVQPTYQVHDLETVTRADVVREYGVSREDLLKNAPNHDGENVVVPRVLE